MRGVISKDIPKHNPENFYDLYRLGSLLGSGAFADVRLIVKLNSSLAQKVMSPCPSVDDVTRVLKTQKDTANAKRSDLFAAKIIYKNRTDVSVLERELKLLCSMPLHPNITGLHEWFEAGDLLILVMDLCTGGDIFERMDEVERFTEDDAVKIVKSLVSAVAFCHENNVIHRDIKPENILYSSTDHNNSEVMLTDFGLGIRDATESAKSSKSSNSNLKTICGTPSYIAPEILLGKGYGFSVDMYACGVLCYELLCGHSPFEEWEEDVMQVYQRILTVGVEFDAEKEPIFAEVSKECLDFMKWLCAKKPEDRLTAQQALDHPWLNPETGVTRNERCLLGQIKSNMELRKDKPLKRAAMAVLSAVKIRRSFSGDSIGCSRSSLGQSESGSLVNSSKRTSAPNLRKDGSAMLARESSLFLEHTISEEADEPVTPSKSPNNLLFTDSVKTDPVESTKLYAAPPRTNAKTPPKVPTPSNAPKTSSSLHVSKSVDALRNPKTSSSTSSWTTTTSILKSNTTLKSSTSNLKSSTASLKSSASNLKSSNASLKTSSTNLKASNPALRATHSTTTLKQSTGILKGSATATAKPLTGTSNSNVGVVKGSVASTRNTGSKSSLDAAVTGAKKKQEANQFVSGNRIPSSKGLGNSLVTSSKSLTKKVAS